MLRNSVWGRSEVGVMPEEDKLRMQEKPRSLATNQHITGAVTLARSDLVCGHNLMTASNPAANAAAAVVPSFVTVRFGGNR